MTKLTFVFTFLILTNLIASPLLAAEFNPNFIISDEELQDKDSMGSETIQKFLEGKDGKLDGFGCLSEGKDISGGQLMAKELTAAQAIYDVAQRWSVSPKFLLVLLQKEQSLITDSTPSQKQYDWATGYGICDNCSMADPALQRWRGFYKQINSAAAQIRYYYDHPKEFSFQVAKKVQIDGTLVSPANQATANMYNYTPHLHGNLNFFNLWTQWFSKAYPDGSLVQVKGDKAVWYLQEGARRLITSSIALKTRFDESKIMPISATDLQAYPEGYPISLANYSLVKSPDGNIYLIVDDQRRLITSMKVFKQIGWNPAEVDDVSAADIANFFEGAPIDENSIYPQGLLAQDSKTGEMFYVQDGVKNPILAKEIATANYPGRKFTKLATAELEKYQTGDPLKFRDGTLLKIAEFPDTYVVSNGKLRWIPDEKTFNDLGYKWKNIISSPYAIVTQLMPQGEPLTP